ncbi:hypothetical protein BN2476_120035 [Paraburkholderia piptadeniae]|uniref:Uncharacterized protein n=2 Tax=Paraburkholderia piptadeniae TaxID=1701573 RepID=A0A1N7RR29_9BURK|nr:hypothetical protein BN2476_120035 [Paraburkholderia piptadeniae]
MTRERVEEHVAALLQRHPLGMTTDPSDCIVAYRSGHGVIYTFLCEDGSGQDDGEFGLEDKVWEEWRPSFERWLGRCHAARQPERIGLDKENAAPSGRARETASR